MKGYKAFRKDLVCRGKQYAENTVFEEDNAVVCNSGMHFCENPFEVLNYYPLVNNDGSFCEYAEVEALADSKTDDGKKFCTTKLRIGAKLSFSAFINACVDFVIEKTKTEVNVDGENSSGNSAQIGSSGDSAKIGSSGYSAKIGSSGDSAQIGSSGYSAQIGSSGNYAKIGSSGYSAQIGSSGYSAQIESKGKHAVVCCAGHGSFVKAKLGSWITLSEWKWDDAENAYIPVCVKTERVDGERIKADTFYALENGEFVEKG